MSHNNIKNLGNNGQQPILPEPASEVALHVANAEGGIFSQETMPTAQKDLRASHMFKKLLHDEAIKKALDEAVKKQQELTKEISGIMKSTW